jgi:hypothetical protein
VAIARKLLIAVWHVLSQDRPDRFAEPEAIAQKFLKFAYQIGKNNRPANRQLNLCDKNWICFRSEQT